MCWSLFHDFECTLYNSIRQENHFRAEEQKNWFHFDKCTWVSFFFPPINCVCLRFEDWRRARAHVPSIITSLLKNHIVCSTYIRIVPHFHIFQQRAAKVFQFISNMVYYWNLDDIFQHTLPPPLLRPAQENQFNRRYVFFSLFHRQPHTCCSGWGVSMHIIWCIFTYIISMDKCFLCQFFGVFCFE